MVLLRLGLGLLATGSQLLRDSSRAPVGVKSLLWEWDDAITALLDFARHASFL